MAILWFTALVDRQNLGFVWTDTLYNVSTPSISPSPSHPSTQSAINHLSATVYCLGLSVIIRRSQEQIIGETPAPYFEVFNFQIVLQDVRSMGLAYPHTLSAKNVEV